MTLYTDIAQQLLLPENKTQARITPRLFIFHSIAAPWTVQRTYEYWRDSTNLESHFGVDYNGYIGQFMDTHVRADANASANNFAISVETASNLSHTDPWTERQLDALVRLGIAAHKRDGIPLRLANRWDGSGYGFHRQFREWSTSGTACPGDARVNQFHNEIFPDIVAGASSAPVAYVPYPGANFFRVGTVSPIITAMGKRLVANGCGLYRVGPGPEWTDVDRQSYAKWQIKLGYSGKDADGIPGPTSWAKLKVPA